MVLRLLLLTTPSPATDAEFAIDLLLIISRAGAVDAVATGEAPDTDGEAGASPEGIGSRGRGSGEGRVLKGSFKMLTVSLQPSDTHGKGAHQDTPRTFGGFILSQRQSVGSKTSPLFQCRRQ